MNMWDMLPGLECLPPGPGVFTSEAQLINNLIRWPYFSHFLPLYASTSLSLCPSLAGAVWHEIWDVCREKPKHSNRSESETCRRKVQRVQPKSDIKCNQWKRHIISGSWIVLVHNLNMWGFPWNKEIKTHMLTIQIFWSLHLFLTLYSLLWSAQESILSFFYKLCPSVFISSHINILG